jgi:hypothetical protein
MLQDLAKYDVKKLKDMEIMRIYKAVIHKAVIRSGLLPIVSNEIIRMRK